MTLQQLERELRSFDWFYQMTDDYSVYIAGREKSRQLKLAAQNLGDEGLALYRKIHDEIMAG